MGSLEYAALAIGGLALAMIATAAVLRRRRRTPQGKLDWEALKADVIDEVHRGRKAQAVKIYRDRTGASLTEAADMVDRIVSQDR